MRQKKKLQKFSMKKPSDRFLLPLLVMLWGAPQSISVAPCQQAPDATDYFGIFLERRLTSSRFTPEAASWYSMWPISRLKTSSINSLFFVVKGTHNDVRYLFSRSCRCSSMYGIRDPDFGPPDNTVNVRRLA
jgi:hypothetical protein